MAEIRTEEIQGKRYIVITISEYGSPVELLLDKKSALEFNYLFNSKLIKLGWSVMS